MKRKTASKIHFLSSPENLRRHYHPVFLWFGCTILTLTASQVLMQCMNQPEIQSWNKCLKCMAAIQMAIIILQQAAWRGPLFAYIFPFTGSRTCLCCQAAFWLSSRLTPLINAVVPVCWLNKLKWPIPVLICKRQPFQRSFHTFSQIVLWQIVQEKHKKEAKCFGSGRKSVNYLLGVSAYCDVWLPAQKGLILLRALHWRSTFIPALCGLPAGGQRQHRSAFSPNFCTSVPHITHQ